MTDKNSFNEKSVIENLKKGNESSLSLLYKAYSEPLFIYAYNILKNKEACEDIIQEVFLNIWRKRETLNINSTLNGYLYTCVLHKIYDFYRKNPNIIEKELIENFNTKIQHSNPETKLIHKELVSQITDIINTLPEKCQIVFKLSREEQLSHKEIAQKLNISTKTVEAHVTIALKTLRNALGKLFSIELILFLCNNFLT